MDDVFVRNRLVSGLGWSLAAGLFGCRLLGTFTPSFREYFASLATPTTLFHILWKTPCQAPYKENGL